MALERFTNEAQSLLLASINAGATSLTVASAASFPTQAQFRLKIENETLLVTGVAGPIFTVTRGIEGSSPASHAAGKEVSHVLTAASLVQAIVDTALTSPTISSPTTTGSTAYQGTKLRILAIPGEVPTSSAISVVIASFAILDNTSVQCDFTASYKAVGFAKAGSYKGSVGYQRTGSPAAIVGASVYATPQTTTPGDNVTWDLSGSTIRVLATSVDADPRNWTCELRIAETLGS